jgi:hypothetical protein
MQATNLKSHTLIDNKGQGAQSHLRTQYQEESRRRSVLWELFFFNQQLDLAVQILPNTRLDVNCKKSHTLIDNKGQGAQSHLRTHCKEEKAEGDPSYEVCLTRSSPMMASTDIQHANVFFGENSPRHLTSNETCP